MIEDRDQSRLDDMAARLSEHFTDHIIMVRKKNGELSWRSSDAVWSESAVTNYLHYIRLGNHLRMVDEFTRRD